MDAIRVYALRNHHGTLEMCQEPDEQGKPCGGRAFGLFGEGLYCCLRCESILLSVHPEA